MTASSIHQPGEAIWAPRDKTRHVPDKAMMANHTLYNCCANGMPPDWSQYDGFEIQAVATEEMTDGGGSTEPVDHRHEAQFFTVYGHMKEGGADCITDVSTERMAETVATLFCKLSGIPTSRIINRVYE